MNTRNNDWRRGFRVGIWSGVAIGSVVVATIVTLWLPYVPDVLRYLELDGESVWGRVAWQGRPNNIFDDPVPVKEPHATVIDGSEFGDRHGPPPHPGRRDVTAPTPGKPKRTVQQVREHQGPF